MTEQEQRIAIAEACGFQKFTSGCWTINGRMAGEYSYGLNQLPNYLYDLNAMNEAENTLPVSKRDEFILNLAWIVAPSNDPEDGPPQELGHLLPDDYWRVCHEATPRQRAEAFLRTKGLLKE